MPDMQPPKYLGEPNPAVSFTFHFQDGALMSWRFDKPWDQVAMFAAIGRLGAEHELGITIDLPEQIRSIEEVQLAHDTLWDFVNGEGLRNRDIAQEVLMEMEQWKAAANSLETLCWLLRDDHNIMLAQNLAWLGGQEIPESEWIPSNSPSP